MKRLLITLLAFLLASAALLTPHLLSEAQNRQYLNKTNRETLPEVVAVHQQLSNEEKIELLISSSWAFLSDFTEASPGIQRFTQYPPQGEEMNLTEAVTRSQQELKKLEEIGVCPSFGLDFSSATVKTEFSKIIDIAQPSRQIAVWQIEYAWDAAHCRLLLDAKDGVIYEFTVEAPFEVHPQESIEQSSQQFVAYHGLTLSNGDSVYEYDTNAVLFSPVNGVEAELYAAVESELFQLGFLPSSGKTYAIVDDTSQKQKAVR